MSNIIFRDSLWVAFSAVLVLFMNFGLAFFYSGYVSRRNVLNTIKMSMITLGIIPIIWWFIGYSLVFSGTGTILGGTEFMFFHGIRTDSVITGTTVLSVAFICFQAMFASISPAITSGAGVERMKFNSYLIFIILWTIIVYCTIAHCVWNPNGIASEFGAFDFAGGVVVHVSAGFSGLALAIVLKPRSTPISEHSKHNLTYTVLGFGMLWFGWFGFNAGSAMAVSSITIIAIGTTLFATSASMLAWLLCDLISGHAKTISGVCGSAVMGLVAITPAAGYVSITSAIFIGAITSVLSYVLTRFYVKLKRKVDDTLDVFTCHGVPGFLGSILVGIFASHEINPSIPNGLIYGNASLLYKQAIVTVCAAAFSFAATYVIIFILDKIIGIRVSVNDEISGLDLLEHGEQAYGYYEQS
jgi:ammonium transporter, Amt family